MEGVTEEAVLATRFLVRAVKCGIPISKKCYVELPQSLADEVQSKRRNCETRIRQLDAMVAKVKELEMKVGMLLDEAGKVGNV